MRSKQNALEIELDLTAQRLLAPPGDTAEVAIDDVVAVANASTTEATTPAEANVEYALDETSEIELTAEQMDALHEGRWP